MYMDFSQVYECKKNNDYCLNYHNNTYNLIRRNESKPLYLYEAVAEVKPYNDLESLFKEFCKKNLPSEFLKLSEKDFGVSSDSKPVVEDIDKQYPDDNADCEVYTIVTFRFPYYNSCDIKSLLEEFIDKAENINYGVSKFGREPTLGMRQPIQDEELNLFFITFEAKYNNFQFNFAEFLYHFTSTDALKQINHDGLVPRSSNPDFMYEDRVYLFNKATQSDIISYAIDKAESEGRHDFAVLKIRSQDLFNWKDYKDGIAKFYVDTKVSNINASEARAIYTYEAIPRPLINDDIEIFQLNSTFGPAWKRRAKLTDF